jgi:hypothetical protein
MSTGAALYGFQIFCYATQAKTFLPPMDQKPRKKVFTLNTLIDGHIIRGHVAFSPAPEPGIMTELARFEAERLLTHTVREEIASGRL